MIHLHPGWLGSSLNIIVINIFVKVYGENEWGILMTPENHAHCDALYDLQTCKEENTHLGVQQ